MSLTRLLAAPLRYRPWVPRHAALILSELLPRRRRGERTTRDHVAAAIDWICRAQNIRDGRPDAGGVSAGWSFADGWLPSYPETSGYIVETLIAAAESLERPELRDRAERILDWELLIQNPDGSFPGHFNEPGARPVVFNTGQIMHGLVSGWDAFGREDCLQAAVRAGVWLSEVMDPDGCYRKHTFQGIPHAYNTRASWALARTARAAQRDDLAAAAARNVAWAVSRQQEDGWFAENSFRPGQDPFTHNIAYVIRGTLETGLALGEERFVTAAELGARALVPLQARDGSLAGTYAEGWRPTARYACITGVAQTSIIWNRLAATRGHEDLRAPAARANTWLKSCQRITGRCDPIDGGIAGSRPLWGGYERFMMPNWAAKFFIDALLMEASDRPIPEDGVDAGS